MLRALTALVALGLAAGAPVSPLIRPLGLAEEDKEALVAFLEALDGEGYQDSGPRSFPRGR